MLDRLRARARALKTEVVAVSIAARDPRTPWYVRALIFFVVAHTLSPIDLIPDFIPVLGYLDDLLITPAGIWLAVRLIPPEVMADARAKAAPHGEERSVAALGAVLIVTVWIAVFIGIVYLLFSR
ncbi:MAG: YkvA family protein [Chloroflexota bacterium]|nr:YkvA family protein [Chloroflexota bacterium]